MASTLGLVSAATPPAAATAPSPRGEEWYFTSWEIQNKIWPITKGRGVTVALLDTGVNAKLPDLAGVVLPGTDVTGEGHGDGRQDTDIGGPGHGTAMAALIAGQGTGSARMVGVAPEARILPIVNDSFEYAAGIRYAADHGAQVISISQGTPDLKGQDCPKDVQAAVGYALDKDIVVVAASGNDGDRRNPSMHPASCAGVLAVGAVDHKNTAWYATERQPYVDVAGPGVLVQSLGKNGEFTQGFSGTSQAAALTSAAVALVRSRFPQMSAREVVQRITASALDSGPQDGKDIATGHGVVRPWHALVGKVPKNAPNPVFAEYDRWKRSQGAQSTNTTGPSAPAASENSNEGLGSMLLIGGAVAAVVLAAIVLGLIMLLRGRSRPAPAMPYPQPGQAAYPRGPQPYRQTGPPPHGAPPGGPYRPAGPPFQGPGQGGPSDPSAPHPPPQPPHSDGPAR